MKNKRKPQRGFTLIELVMVIVILGIMAAVALPKFTDLSSDAKTSASDGIEGALKSTAAMAFASHRAKNLTASGTTAGVDQFITDCASLVAYMQGGAWPSNTSCTSSVITYPDGKKSTVTTWESTSTAAIIPTRS